MTISPFAQFFFELVVVALVVPMAFVMLTILMRHERKGPIPTWADVAALVASFDIATMAESKNWSMMFLNPKLQELAGPILAVLFALSLVVWILLLVVVEPSNERNYNFTLHAYTSKGRRFAHWCLGTFPVVLLFSFHFVPFLFPASIHL